MKTPQKKRSRDYVTPDTVEAKKHRSAFDSLVKKGLTLPGYNYCGPFNSLDNGPPTNGADAACKEHDEAYNKLGKRAYFYYNDADEELLKKLKTESGFGSRIGSAFFNAKKLIAPRLSLQKATDSQQGVTSVSSNAMSAPRAGGGAGSGNNQGLKETEIDDVDPHQVFRGPPDYTFASLPYHYDGLIEDVNTFNRDIVLRMTSPYDPMNKVVYQDLNAGLNGSGRLSLYYPVPDTSDDLVRSANWWSYYSGLYQYYHTISCRWSVFVENFGPPIWVYFMYMNDEIPPPTATNLDIQSWPQVEYYYVNSPVYGVDTVGARAQAFLRKKDDQTQMEDYENREDEEGTGGAVASIDHVPADNVVSRSGTTTLQKFGTYTPGSYNREIRLDADVENWTRTNTNPKLPEKLVIRIKPNANQLQTNSAVNGGDEIRCRVRLKCDYLVEFKELDFKLRYPVVYQPLTVTLNNAQTPAS